MFATLLAMARCRAASPSSALESALMVTESNIGTDPFEACRSERCTGCVGRIRGLRKWSDPSLPRPLVPMRHARGFSTRDPGAVATPEVGDAGRGDALVENSERASYLCSIME